MADRSFIPHGGTLECDVKELFANVSIGASGAPTLNTSPGSVGIKSIVRNSAGKYTITLSDSYQKVLWASAQIMDSTNSDPTTVGCVAKLVSENVSNATPTVVIQFYDMATPFTAADPRNGATVLVKLELRNSTVT